MVLRVKIPHEGQRSVGDIVRIPGEHTWRVVDAPGCLVIHCLWVAGRANEKGNGTLLLDECPKDAQRHGKCGAVMISSQGNWLAYEKVFLKNGFVRVGSAPPSFQLLVKLIGDGPRPSFPEDWSERLASFSPGRTVVYADQCPHMPDAASHAVGIQEVRGLEVKTVRIEDAREGRVRSPSPHGVFAIVMDGQLLSDHQPGTKELPGLKQMLA